MTAFVPILLHMFIQILLVLSCLSIPFLVSSRSININTDIQTAFINASLESAWLTRSSAGKQRTGQNEQYSKLIERAFLVSRSNTKLDATNELDTSIRKRIRSNANQNAQNVFALLASRYNAKSSINGANPSPESNSIDLSSPEWTKAKRYIYHATSPSSTKNPLSIHQIKSVLDFLDDTFDSDMTGGDTSLNSLFIIQSVPRIFRKDPDSYLKPTVEFLQGLYGTSMFYEFVKRRPEVLLTSGVGYNAKNTRNRDESGYSSDSLNIDGVIIEEVSAIESNNGLPSVTTYLETQDLGLSQHHFSILKTKYPAVFQLSPSKVRSTIQFLLSCVDSAAATAYDKSPDQLDATHESKNRIIVGKMIKANPNILNLSLTNLRSKVDFFQTQCGFNTSEKLIILWKKYPGILSLSLEKNLRPTMQLMLDLIVEESEVNLDTCSKKLHKTLSSHPQLLALSPHNLASKAAHFDKIDANCPKGSGSTSSLASRIAMSAPSVYSLSLKQNIIPKIEALSHLWGISNDANSDGNVTYSRSSNSRSLSKRIAEYPNVLTLSLEGNIQPSISFYHRTGYITSPTNIDNSTISSSSADSNNYLPARYLAASLYNRLLPRWNFHIVQEAILLNQLQSDVEDDLDESQPVQDTSPSVTKPPLHVIAGATDEMFCRRMKYDYETYRNFKKEAVPRLKFSSQFDTWLKTGRPIDLDSDAGIKK
jgi:hypothetical protein